MNQPGQSTGDVQTLRFRLKDPGDAVHHRELGEAIRQQLLGVELAPNAVGTTLRLVLPRGMHRGCGDRLAVRAGSAA